MTDFWATFTPQLLASLAGAAVGVAGVLIGFALQRGAGRDDQVDDAVVGLLAALASYADGIDAYWAGRPRFIPLSGQTVIPGPPRPAGYAVSGAFEILEMRTKGAQREQVARISAAWTPIVEARGPASARAAGVLAGIIADWRKGVLSEETRKLEHVHRIAKGEKQDGTGTP